MKKKSLIYTALLLALANASCTHESTGTTDETSTGAATTTQDTLLIVTVPENAIWGHLGEGTAMSAIEFITDNGDTLALSKTEELTGREARILGSLRNFTDRYCITVNPDTTALVKAINVTEMQETWADAPEKETPPAEEE